MIIRFTANYDAEFIDPYCQCRKVIAYKAGWCGNVGEVIAQAALEAGKAERIDDGETGDNQGNSASADISPEKRHKRNRASASNEDISAAGDS